MSTVMRTSIPSPPPARLTLVRVLVILAVAAFAVTVAAGMVARGWSFYVLDLDARVDHPEFRQLSPSGSIGRRYGEIGAGLMALNLLYLLRRRLARLPLGAMRAWLDVHVVTGLLAAVFVVVHSAAQLRSPLATLLVVSLGLVIVTGVIGRCLFAVAPKPDPNAMRQAKVALEAVAPGLGEWCTSRVAAIAPTKLPGDAGLVRSLLTIPVWMAEARERREAVALSVDGWAPLATRPAPERGHARRLASRMGKIASREVRATAAATILLSWRSLHRLFAILMVLAVGLHIGVAVYYGMGEM